ncbi:VOC family protein [Algoriphagus vanfongensis]|uniref:VOC family protein n=1 Tax=Algoriphagus vanfongensis TaxID=426371 RepID=UPI00040B9600|nr:VOC family protein [Algoriphagus vanfongensis]
MATVNIYLTFNGNCEEAFNFYKSVFGGDFTYVGRFNEMPPQEGQPPMSEEDGNKIMHITLPISAETCIMGSDTGGEWASNFQVGNNFSISVSADSKADADRFFNSLSEGGQVSMSMADTFWGSYFGMLVDQFGIAWMVGYDAPQE